MIEIRLRAAASNPTSRPWRWGISLAAMVLAVVAPVATSRAQDASASSRMTLAEVESLRAMKVVAIDGGDSVSITSGAASITLKRDGTIVLKGTDIVLDNAKTSAKTAQPTSTFHPNASEVF